MNKDHYIYMLGIGGIGMSALARWYLQQGMSVFGHDMTRSSLTDQLEAAGIPIHFAVSPEAIPSTILNNRQNTLVVYSPSILPSNPIWAYLKAHQYTLWKRADVLGEITAQYDTIAVAGTHGKTTTTALLAHVLYQAKRNITAFVGGILKNYNTNFITTHTTQPDRTVIIEADEYDRFFLNLHPDIAIITTIDPDHLEVYGNTAGFEEGFRQFLAKLPATGLAILHQDVATKLLTSCNATKDPVQRYGLTKAPIHAQGVHINTTGHFCFDYVSEEITIKDIHLCMPGYHNIENTLAVITTCLHKQVPPSLIREAIHTFEGVARRFDVILEQDGCVLIDDYGHHPVEIRTLLTTVRTVYPGKKVTVIFQPNQYSRTQDFLHELAQSLSLADAVLITDIYSDREKPIEGINSAAILAHISLPCKYVCNNENLIETLAKVDQLEVIVNVGAGTADLFIAPIKAFLLGNRLPHEA